FKYDDNGNGNIVDGTEAGGFGLASNGGTQRYVDGYPFTDFAQTHVGLLLLFGWSLALYYHLCNGIRHLFWDMGYLFKIKNANRAGYVVLIATFILTVGTWCYALVNHATCFGGL
ncbi:MAG: succinate dehydrogenase, cytochrome b556 subunit, partial [Bdellovibrionales bacterium]